MLGISPKKNAVYIMPVKVLKSSMISIKLAPIVESGDLLLETFDFTDGFIQKVNKVFLLESTSGGGTGVFSDHCILADSASNCSTILLQLTAAQMNHDMLVITASDKDGASGWADNSWIIYPDARITQFAHLDTDISLVKTDTGVLRTSTSSIKAVTDALPDAGALTTLGGETSSIKAVTDALPDAGALTTLGGETSSIKAVTDALPDAGALTTLGGETSSIKAVTDALPDAGALTTLGGETSSIKAVTDALPDAGALTTLSGETSSIKAVTDALPDAGALTTLSNDAKHAKNLAAAKL